MRRFAKSQGRCPVGSNPTLSSKSKRHGLSPASAFDKIIMDNIYIEREFREKSQLQYTCIDCGWSGFYRDIQIAIDVNETLRAGVKVEVMFCGNCGGDNFK